MLLGFERDPYARSLETTVIGRGADEAGAYIVLADTILFPEGGGQPADHGTVEGVRVRDVHTRGAEIRHYVEAGVPTGHVRVELDWARRFDHMQQHTAQHLLTAIAATRFEWHTTAFHLGGEIADIELDVARIDPGNVSALEEAVADAVRAARAVTARRVSPEEFARLPVRTRGLPEGHRGDIRLVEIAGIDCNTCGGTHLRTTAEIETLKILGTENMRGGTRLRFVAGSRLRRLLGEHEARAAQLRQLLGGADAEIPALAAAKLEQLKEAGRRIRGLEEELAVEASKALAASTAAVVAAHWSDRSLPFLQRVATQLAALAPDKTALLTAGEEAGAFVLCGSGDDIRTLGVAVAEVLQGRGGGSGRVYQGKAGALAKRDEALAVLRRRIGTSA